MQRFTGEGARERRKPTERGTTQQSHKVKPLKGFVVEENHGGWFVFDLSYSVRSLAELNGRAEGHVKPALWRLLETKDAGAAVYFERCLLEFFLFFAD